MIAQMATREQTVRVPSAMMRPILSDDVAAALADIALAEPLVGTIELAGPDSLRMDELVRELFRATGDTREVVTDPDADYFAASLDDESLVPSTGAVRFGPTRYHEWLRSVATPGASIHGSRSSRVRLEGPALRPKSSTRS